MNEDIGVGMFIGTWIGIVIVAVAIRICGPSGDESVIKDCLSDKPNICRTITTYTTPYKEER